MIRYAVLESPVGPVAVAWKDDTVVAARMEEASERRAWDTTLKRRRPLTRMKEELAARFPGEELKETDRGTPVRALNRYFDGDVRAVDALDADPGGTPFQQRVCKALRRIAPGSTRTYAQIADAAGSPGAARAAGGAVGWNPIPIIIPCHRVVGTDRKLTGFGGGLPRKQWLLEHEGAIEARLL